MSRARLVTALLSTSVLLVSCGEPSGTPRAAPPDPERTRPAATTYASPTITERTTTQPGATPTDSTATSATPPVDLIDRTVAAMSLRDKARQLLVVEFSGTSAPSPLIRSLHPGGLIYFSDNLRNNDQIRTLSRTAQQVSRQAGQPLLLMTDQEGGLVTRLPGTTDVPGGAEFGGDARWARRTARGTGVSMRRLGLNVDLAPVADVNTAGDGGVIGPRSFSSDPDVVSRLVRAQICGYHDGGVAAAAKHFPGHGSTLTDSHATTAAIERSARSWGRIDRPPFAAAVRAGVDLVLVGHLSFRALDPSGHPATISGRLDRDLLRSRMGFDGVVITDALNMGGITSWGSSPAIAVRAIRSGVDLLLMPPRPASVVRGLVAAVRAGRLTEVRIDRSVERVLRLKQRLGLYRADPNLPHC